MKLLPLCTGLILAVAVTSAQMSNDEAEKPGSCPPALPVNVCEESCSSDGQCRGSEKCCRTNCGGTACSKPVTAKATNEKPGVCPKTPTGRWVCSSTCTYDSDCRGNLKCCVNRCGAMGCLKPDIEVIESVEIPVEPVEVSTNDREISYNRPPSNTIPSNNEPSNYPSNRNPANYPSNRDSSNYPSNNEPSNYPSNRNPVNYPSNRDSSNYPSNNEPSNYPSNRNPVNYPSNRDPSNYSPNRYPVDYPSNRNPLNRNPSNYPSNYPLNYPFNYPSNYPSNRYPSNYPSIRYPTNYRSIFGSFPYYTYY